MNCTCRVDCPAPFRGPGPDIFRPRVSAFVEHHTLADRRRRHQRPTRLFKKEN